MIVRHPKNDNYSVIHNHGLTNVELSWKARGLLAYLLTKPDNWEVMMAHLINSAPDGREAVRTGLTELENAGYIVRQFTRTEKGAFDGQEVVLHEYPLVDTGNGLSDYGLPVSGLSDYGKSPTSKDPIPLNTEKELITEPTSANAGEIAEKKVSKKARGSLFTAVSLACGFVDKPTTKEAKRIGAVVKDLLERPGPPTPEEVTRMAQAYRERYRIDGKPLDLTPEAMTKHWNTFAPKPAQALDTALAAVFDTFDANKQQGVPPEFARPRIDGKLYDARGRTFTLRNAGSQLTREYD